MQTKQIKKIILFSILLGSAQASWGACDQTLSLGADLASVLSNAAAGSTICLNNGNYGNVTISGISKSSAVTLQSINGVGATIGITLSSSNLLTFKNLTFSMLTWSDNVNTNIRVLKNTFIGQMSVWGNGNGTPQNNVIDGNVFDGISACNTCNEGRLQIYGGGNLVVSNNHFGNGGDSDGIQVGGYGTIIGPGNVFDSIIYTGGRHVDPIQLYGEVDHETIIGNYFINSNDSIMAPDGGANVTVSDNVFAGNGVDYWQVMFGSQSNLTFIHNTLANDIGVTIDAKSGSPSSSNVVARDNIMSGTFKLQCTSCSITHNLFINSTDAVGTNNMIATPTFIGGSKPTAWVGYQLASTSAGYKAATDGMDMGSTLFGNNSQPLSAITLAAPQNLRLN
ncbi:MAG: hypothetical protein ACXWRE_06320 [Pseudobdellovibrionaceae bacterium]